MNTVFTGSPEQRRLVCLTADEGYREIGEKYSCHETIYRSPYCLDITRRLVPKLRSKGFPAIPVGTFDDGFGFGDEPLYFHRFINLGNGWLADPDWQFYLEDRTRNIKNFLAKLKKGAYPPKVLIARISEFDNQLLKLGVHQRNLPSWENKTRQVEEIKPL